MTSRAESVANLQETYTYDDLDRLTSITPKTGAQQTFTYHTNGNILSNSLVGSYVYDNTKKNAVTKINQSQNIISPADCAVSYNFFNQPSQITEGNNQLDIFYGADQQRSMAKRFDNNTLEHTRYFVSKYYEKEVTLRNLTHHYNYIYADDGVVALHITNQTAGTDSLYYIHTDHLGSFCAITNKNKTVRQRNFFDPWGNPVEKEELTGFTLINRGFTGHEHYPQFKIINMNGRLYDPVICRFFSPDNFVQMPEFTQSYNRYSYCLNNPLMYIDPTGQLFTKYIDQQGSLLYETNDGLSDIIVIHDKDIPKFENKLNELNKIDKINDADANRKELHTLGMELLKYAKKYDTGDPNLDAGFTAGYDIKYENKSTIPRDILYFGLSFGGKEGGQMNTGYYSGKKQGAEDRRQGNINVLKPFESLKNNPPLLKLQLHP